MNWKHLKNLRAVALTALLTAPLILTGCASLRPGCEPPEVYKCDQPELGGETWADLAILAAEQRAAIEACNIRNSPYFRSEAIESEAPTPAVCRKYGVRVRDGRHATGRIVDATTHKAGGVEQFCGAGAVGCTVRVGPGLYRVHFESRENNWILIHERCHALYEEFDHTADYNRKRPSRGGS